MSEEDIAEMARNYMELSREFRAVQQSVERDLGSFQSQIYNLKADLEEIREIVCGDNREYVGLVGLMREVRRELAEEKKRRDRSGRFRMWMERGLVLGVVALVLDRLTGGLGKLIRFFTDP